MVGELDFRLSSGEQYDVFFGKTRFFIPQCLSLYYPQYIKINTGKFNAWG